MSYGKIVMLACGSFSPPTFMHLRLFEIAKDYIHALNLGTVIGGLVSPVHDSYGKKDLAPSNHRIAMLKLALKSSTWIKLTEWETQQSAWSRTRVTLQHHQETIDEYLKGNQCSDPPSWLPNDIINRNSTNNSEPNCNKGDAVTVKLLCGADLLESFAKPGLWAEEDLEAIIGCHGLVVMTRAGADPGRFIYESDILYKYRKNVLLVTNYISNEVSSTQIRRLVRRGESAKYLVDDAVLAYVKQNRLYGAPSSDTSLESYLIKDCDYDDYLYRRRVSEGNMEKVEVDTAVKKRCSSTIRKLKPEDMKKSKSEGGRGGCPL